MFLDGFDDLRDIENHYQITNEETKGIEILFAAYESGCYDGSSIVVFKKEEKLYIVEASHCSCYGLEGQWQPVETNAEALMKEAVSKSKYSYAEFKSFIAWVTETFAKEF